MKDFINKDMDISLAEKFNIGPGQYSNISVTELPFSIRVINRFRGNGIQTVGDMLSRTENELSKFRGFGANCLKEIEAYCIHLSQENDDSIAHSSFNMKPRVHALVSNNLKNVLRFDNRPFPDTENMDEYMIQCWNGRVTEDDTVYVLGDAFWKNEEGSVNIMHRLNGHKHLIKGNHDRVHGKLRFHWESIQD